MNKDRHTFYSYIIFNEFNKITCEGRFNLENQVPTYNTKVFDELCGENFFPFKFQKKKFFSFLAKTERPRLATCR